MTSRRRWDSRADRWFAARYDAALAREESTWLGPLRSRLLADLDGDVLEVGAGTGANRDHYPASITSLTLLEPSPHMRERLTAAYGGHRLAPRITDTDAQDLQHWPDACADVVVATLVLCSVPDPLDTARHVRRLLRPGGRFVIIEHVRAAGFHGRVQHWVTPATRRFAHGCHQDRDTESALRTAGFDVSAVAVVTEAGRGLVRPMIAGSCPRDPR